MFELLVARRYLRSMRRRKRVSFTALVAAFGVALGVAALAIVLSVSNGFSGMVWERLLGINAHITVRKAQGARMEGYGALVGRLAAHPEVVGAAPFVEQEGFVLRRSPGGEVYNSGVVVRGVAQEGLLETSDLAQYFWSGGVDLGPQQAGGPGQVYGMVIGRYLADRLGAMLGTEVHLGMLPDAVLTAQPPMRRYVVTGIFNTGNPDLDAGLVFVSLHAAQRDLGWEGEATGIRLRLRDAFAAGRVCEELNAALREAGLSASPWMADHGSLYFSINLEKWASFLALGLIVVVAGFNIISILTMNVAERRREIGILKAMGATPASIARVFTLQGMSIGLAGVALGDLLGFALCWVQMRFEVLKVPGDMLIVSALPVDVQAFDFAAISVAAVAVCYLFARLPARGAAALDPVEAIRL